MVYYDYFVNPQLISVCVQIRRHCCFRYCFHLLMMILRLNSYLRNCFLQVLSIRMNYFLKAQSKLKGCCFLSHYLMNCLSLSDKSLNCLLSLNLNLLHQKNSETAVLNIGYLVDYFRNNLNQMIVAWSIDGLNHCYKSPVYLFLASNKLAYSLKSLALLTDYFDYSRLAGLRTDPCANW